MWGRGVWGDGDEEFIGLIAGIEYKKKKEGNLPKGYYLRATRILDGKVDESEAGTRLYAIDAALASLILPGDNPSFTFRSAP